MKYLKNILFLLVISLLPSITYGAEPVSTAPSYDPVPGEFGAGNQKLTVPLPPTFPAYLPNGAINLDEAWIEDGGARLYWNTVIIPRQLKMNGNYWVDPALVPLLIPQATTPVRRNYSRVVRPKAKSPAPKNAASTALKTPAIPLPVQPVPAKTTARVPAPFSPAKAKTPAAPAAAPNVSRDTGEMIPPPRLQ